MDEALLSTVEGLVNQVFDLEHHLADPAQGAGNLNQITLDHGEWKVDEGFNTSAVGDLGDPIEIRRFSGATPLTVDSRLKIV